MIRKTPLPPSLDKRYPYLHERLLPKKKLLILESPRKASRTLAPSRSLFLPRFPFPYAQFLTYMLLTHWLLTPLVASQLVLTLNCTGAIGVAHWCPSQMLWIRGNPPAVWVLLCQLLMRNCQRKTKIIETLRNKRSSPKKRLTKFILGSRGGPDSLSLQSPLWGPQRNHRLEIFQQLRGDSLMFTCQAGQAYAEFIDTERI